MDLGQTLHIFLETAVDFIPKMIVAIMTFVATLLLSGWAARWVRHTVKLKYDDPETLQLLSRLARWMILVLGTVVALDQVDFNVTGFVAGLGIVGFTVGFAMQDITRNFVAGILLLVRQPFNIGEAVTMAGFSGQVMEINVRDTVLKTWDGEKVIIPNSAVFTGSIVNYSEYPYRRRTIRIGLGYGQDVRQAMQTFVAAGREVEGVLPEPAPTIQAEALGDASVSLALRFWVDQTTHGLLDVHSDVVLAINAQAEQAGIELPYPIQTVRLEKI